MRKLLPVLFLFCFLVRNASAQKYWTGAGLAGQWSDGNNWSGGTVPVSGDDVILDNTNVAGSYNVFLPNTSVTIKSVQIVPSLPNIITLVLPNTNTLHPAITFNGPGYVLIIGNNGAFKNSSGASSSTPDVIGIASTDSIKINNGGKYIHNNARAHAYLVDQSSKISGTEKGIFKFDVPGAGGYTLSLTGNKFGTLELAADSAGGTKNYSGNGSNDLTIRGDLLIDNGVSFNAALTANINIAGDLSTVGNFDNSPTSGSTGRSIFFNGTTNQTISGNGNFTFSTNFRNIKINRKSVVTLARNISLNTTDVSDSLIVDTSAILILGTNKISGAGIFRNYPGSYLSSADVSGITTAPTLSGNVQTGIRTFDTLASYEYNATAAQVTGNALPGHIAQLVVNNIGGISLSNAVIIKDSLSLLAGKLFSTATNYIELLNLATVHSGSSSYLNLLATYPVNTGTANSYVVGPIKKDGLVNQTFVFPVGNFFHRPVILKNASGDFQVAYVEQNPYTAIANGNVMDAVLNHVSHIEYWNINSINGTADIELTFYDPNSGGVTQLSSLRVAQHDGTKWNSIGNTSTLGTPGTNGSITSNAAININGVTPFTLASTAINQNPLPVYIKYFRLKNLDVKNFIEWGIENDNAYKSYTLERSLDGISYTGINLQLSKLNNVLTWYNYTDAISVNCFYRLKLISNTEEISYSNVLKATKNLLFSIYPNPVSKNIIVNFPAVSSISEIEIVNSSGVVIKNIKTSLPFTTINVESLAKGMYFLRFRNQQQAISRRFFKE